MLELSQLPQSGIVTLNDWEMAGDGHRYKYVFCSHWRIVTDGMIPIDKFRSTERWQLFGWVGDKIVAMFPGCKVQGYIVSEKCPIHTENHQDENVKDSGTPVGVFDLDNNKGIF